jgi:arylsulfatase
MQLRRNGVRFNNYFTPTAPCSPARSVIFTGHHTVDNGVVDNIAA